MFDFDALDTDHDGKAAERLRREMELDQEDLDELVKVMRKISGVEAVLPVTLPPALDKMLQTSPDILKQVQSSSERAILIEANAAKPPSTTEGSTTGSTQ